jgi:hypothetical protein
MPVGCRTRISAEVMMIEKCCSFNLKILSICMWGNIRIAADVGSALHACVCGRNEDNMSVDTHSTSVW